jgi:hypothetical protein
MQHTDCEDHPSRSHASIEWAITDAVGARSSAKCAGRENGTSAPCCFAIWAISSSSVDTTTCSNNPEILAASIAYPIIGLPAKALMFFRGMRLLPPRAGMTARLTS